METNLPDVMKVQASELGLEVPKYPQEAQNAAKVHPSTLALQNYLVSDKKSFEYLNKKRTLTLPGKKYW